MQRNSEVKESSGGATLAEVYGGVPPHWLASDGPKLSWWPRAKPAWARLFGPAEEFAAGHIPQALSIPVHELKRRLAELPRTKDIVAYCRGPYCVQSDEAVSLLRRQGFNARRLEVGLPDWRANALQVDITKPVQADGNKSVRTRLGSTAVGKPKSSASTK